MRCYLNQIQQNYVRFKSKNRDRFTSSHLNVNKISYNILKLREDFINS